MTLRSLLSRLPNDKTFIVSVSGEWGADRISGELEILRVRLSGARVALQFADPGKALRALVALDGVAEAVALIPATIDPTLVVRLVCQGEFEILLCDHPEFFIGKHGDLNVYPDLERIPQQRIARPQPEETRWVLATSGTTGLPKLVGHKLSSLIRTTKIDPVRGAGLCWGLLYDYTRFAGLQVLLQSILSGSRLIVPQLDATLEEKLALLIRSGCTHLSATPTMWRKLVMMPGVENLALQQVTLGGEIADDRILTTLSRIFPAARISHVFASTEAGVGFSVTDRKAGFPESFLTSPPAGIDLRVVEGRLYVRNKDVQPTYVGTDTFFSVEDGWIDTGDSVVIENGRVLFLGRASGLINVGGDKVHPEEVERILLSHPDVIAVRVYAKSSAITGALVAADVVLRNPCVDLNSMRNDLRLFAASALDRHKVPAVFAFLTDLECSAAGKLVRK